MDRRKFSQDILKKLELAHSFDDYNWVALLERQYACTHPAIICTGCVNGAENTKARVHICLYCKYRMVGVPSVE